MSQVDLARDAWGEKDGDFSRSATARPTAVADADARVSSHAATDDLPNWNAIDEDVTCPLCEYNLRGLATPRCPECGYRFTWQEMLAPERRRHPFLFEHHPNQNYYSFRMTLWHGLWPRRFWTTMHPVQPHRKLRMLVYFLLVSILSVALYVPSTVIQTAIVTVWSLSSARENDLLMLNQSGNEQWRDQLIRRYGSVEAYLDAIYPKAERKAVVREIWKDFNWMARFPGFVLQRWGFLIGSVVLWPLATIVSLMVFQASMRRARIRLVHVARAVVYSYDVVLWMTGAMLLVALLKLTMNLYTVGLMEVASYGAAVILLGIFSYRLWAAYRYYLRFDRPIATVAASQLIALLLVANLVLGIIVW